MYNFVIFFLFKFNLIYDYKLLFYYLRIFNCTFFNLYSNYYFSF